MNIKLLFRTVRHLKVTQIVHQVKNRIYKAKYVPKSAPAHTIPVLEIEPIPRYKSMDGEKFTFLNLTHHFTDWNFLGNGTLFTYNQNYFDFINTDDIETDEACRWIDRFIADQPSITWGMDPYPIALRSINWMKFFCKHPECVTKKREDTLWSQLCLLEEKLEYHLLGNHLLEDSYTLYIGGCYFNNIPLKQKGYKILIAQLKEQTLPDGAHYEQSPMYHCILLDRLLDCVNFGSTDKLRIIAQKQLGWLEAICYKDGSWPMFNDAALGIAPTPCQIFNYARRLGLSWGVGTLKESGYRKLSDSTVEAFVDCGHITATYQPGHSHADALNYELRINGTPVVVDTGISTYDKTPRRQFERSTIAHNCVSVNGKNSDEVWGGFRVGRHCNVKIVHEAHDKIEVYHDGFGKSCSRSFFLMNGIFTIVDKYDGDAISYIHLAAGADPGRVKIEGASSIEIQDSNYSVEYNRFIDNKTIAIHFNGIVKYSIS